jgi:hypothetical protein
MGFAQRHGNLMVQTTMYSADIEAEQGGTQAWQKQHSFLRIALLLRLVQGQGSVFVVSQVRSPL